MDGVMRENVWDDLDLLELGADKRKGEVTPALRGHVLNVQPPVLRQAVGQAARG